MQKNVIFLALCLFFVASACQKQKEEPQPLPARVEVVLELDDEVKSQINQSIARSAAVSRSARVVPGGTIDVSDVVDMTDAQWTAEGYIHSRDYGDLSANLRNNIFAAFQRDLENWIARTEANGGTDEQIMTDLKNTIRQSYNRSGTYSTYQECVCTLVNRQTGQVTHTLCRPGEQPTGYVGQTCQQVTRHVFGLTEAERQVAQETFWGVEQYMDQAFTLLMPYAQADVDANPGGRVDWRRFWGNLGRAVARVAIGIAVTAAVVALAASGVGLVGVAVGVTKFSAIGASVKAALLKGYTIGSFKASSALSVGASGGLKHAVKNWDKGWQGISEFFFGIKLQPVYS